MNPVRFGAFQVIDLALMVPLGQTAKQVHEDVRQTVGRGRVQRDGTDLYIGYLDKPHKSFLYVADGPGSLTPAGRQVTEDILQIAHRHHSSIPVDKKRQRVKVFDAATAGTIRLEERYAYVTGSEPDSEYNFREGLYIGGSGHLIS